ncbi:hypothetical protein ASF91_13545 [Rhizobium sp. Leaf155]|nr:hypothetical protein ASF91_13545 [Rhizobium sp. Leaf155]
MRFRSKFIAGALYLLATGTAWSVPADLPLLNADDISLTNNLASWGSAGRISFEVKGERCDRIRIILDNGETEKISCPDARYFVAYTYGKKKDRTDIYKEMKLSAGSHYWFGLDAADFESPTLIDVSVHYTYFARVHQMPINDGNISEKKE